MGGFLHPNQTERPEEWSLNRDHPLWRDCVFFGGGRYPGTNHYNDASGRGNHGVLTNMQAADDWVWSPELGRWVLDFDGLNDFVAIPPTSLALQGANSFSACVWARDIATDADSRVMSGWGPTADTDRRFTLWFDAGGTNPSIAFAVQNSSTTYVIGTNQATWSAGTWHHLVGTWKPSIAAVYADGVWQESIATAATLNLAANLTLGTLFTSGGTGWVEGNIADAMLFNRVLTSPEIRILADRSDPMLGGALAYPRRVSFPAAAVAAGRVRYHPGMSGLRGGGQLTHPGISGGLNA